MLHQFAQLAAIFLSLLSRMLTLSGILNDRTLPKSWNNIQSRLAPILSHICWKNIPAKSATTTVHPVDHFHWLDPYYTRTPAIPVKWDFPDKTLRGLLSTLFSANSSPIPHMRMIKMMMIVPFSSHIGGGDSHNYMICCSLGEKKKTK